MKHRHHRTPVAAACTGAAALMCLGTWAQAQISRPTEAELDAAPAQFQNLVHGRSDKIDQNVRPTGMPPRETVKPIPNPHKDPHDLRGYWALGGGPGGPGGPGAPPDRGGTGAAGGPRGGGGPPGAGGPGRAGGPPGAGGGDAPGLPPGGGPNGSATDSRPGTLAHVGIDGNRMCLVSLGVNPASMQVYQSPSQLTFVYDNQLRARRIYLNAKHNPVADLTYNGDSVAHWVGNTLIVDTVRIKGAITLLGFDLENGVHTVLLATPTLHVIERISRSADGSKLTDVATWEDPAVGSKPYTSTSAWSYVAGKPSYDFECEDVGDMFGPNYGGGFAGGK